MKLLIVEPEANRQRQLRTILASLGHKSADIETAADERSTIPLLKKRRFNCSFICLDPPALDAVALLKMIRSTKISEGLPVVVYSPQVSKETVITAVEAGANTFLAYPFSVSDVEQAIQRAIKSGAANRTNPAS